MTRREFIEDITTWSELIDFCNDEGCERYVEDVYDTYAYDDHINDSLSERTRHEDWEEILSWLSDLPRGYDYYICDYNEWREADDDDFDSIKGYVLEYMDDNDFWDEDEEEAPVEDSSDTENTEDEEPIEDEGVSFAELFTSCSNNIQHIKSEETAAATAKEQEEAEAFDELCVSVGISITM